METEYRLEKFSSGMHYIMVDKVVADQFVKTGSRRAICRINHRVDFHCAFMMRKEGGYFVNIGSKICKKLKIHEGSKVIATFMTDNSKYQFEMPDELSEVLKQDMDANNIFNNLTEGNQRSLIYLVSQVISSEKKIERSLMIAEKLKMNITSPRMILKK